MAMPKARVLAPLNSGDVNSAQAKFDSVLAGNPNDGDALAGLGYIAQRKGDFASAAEYLTRAAQQGGPSGAQWSTQAEDSAFYARLAQAKDVAAGGNYASALAVVPPLTQQSGDKGQSAGLLRADDAVRPLVAKISAQRSATPAWGMSSSVKHPATTWELGYWRCVLSHWGRRMQSGRFRHRTMTVILPAYNYWPGRQIRKNKEKRQERSCR